MDDQSCTVCGQSATYPACWADCRDPETGRQEVGFGTCEECGTLGVCGDCLHESVCCDVVREMREDQALAPEAAK